MVLQLDNGKYLHTAYAISNIAEELGADDWSLTDQEGMLYIGTYIDGNSVDSTDPTAYNWEELVDEDVDDEDSEGIMPVADFQSQIDALADQIGIQQSTTEELQESVQQNEQNLSSSTELANNAQQIAGNTNQYFWHTESGTDTGAHITEIPQEQFLEDPSNGGGNLLARSNGIAVRDGLTELATFGATGARIGKYEAYGDTKAEVGAGTFKITHASSGTSSSISEETVLAEVASTGGLDGYYTFGTRESNSTIGNRSFAEGSGVTASGIASHAEGMLTEASGLCSHAEGQNPVASGQGSHAEGVVTTASGSGSHAEGGGTIASGEDSHAEGRNTQASGLCSHASGEGTIASRKSQMVIGEYNIEDAGGTDETTRGDYALIIGNGTSSSSSGRSNALTADWDGNVTASGNITGANLIGSQTADYTGSYTMGNCTILTGSVTINVTTANTNTDKAVTFGPTFKHTPCVQCTMLNIGGSYYQRVTVAGPSTTGFTARIRAGGTPGNVVVNWMAIGELA